MSRRTFPSVPIWETQILRTKSCAIQPILKNSSWRQFPPIPWPFSRSILSLDPCFIKNSTAAMVGSGGVPLGPSKWWRNTDWNCRLCTDTVPCSPCSLSRHPTLDFDPQSLWSDNQSKAPKNGNSDFNKTLSISVGKMVKISCKISSRKFK